MERNHLSQRRLALITYQAKFAELGPPRSPATVPLMKGVTSHQAPFASLWPYIPEAHKGERVLYHRGAPKTQRLLTTEAAALIQTL